MNLSTLYQLPKDDVNRLISAAVGFLQRFDVTVHLTNLDRIVETEAYRDGPDVYAVQKAAASDDEHHETCISDGLEVWLHGEIDHPGGECSRLYDLLHVGCGHFFQWSADATSGLSYFGDEAWGMASRSFLRASEQDIQMVWKYEYEAARLATGCLNELLKSGGFGATLCSRVKRMFNDYAATDLEYITAYYRTGAVKDIFEGWLFDAASIPPLELSFPVRPIRRSNKCIALLRQQG
jgi:hypothetical protein